MFVQEVLGGARVDDGVRGEEGQLCSNGPVDGSWRKTITNWDGG